MRRDALQEKTGASDEPYSLSANVTSVVTAVEPVVTAETALETSVTKS